MGVMTLRHALEEYRNVYMAYRNFADRTRVEYQNDLEDFAEFVERAGTNYANDLGLPIIERYAAHLEQQGFASLTRKRKIVSVRSLLAFLYHDGHISTDIAKKVVLPFTESPTPKVLTQTECDKIRRACAGSPRDRAIVELILQTGIKLSELVHLTMDDIQLDEEGDHEGYIRILGSRSKKERLIPLNIKASLAIKDYLGVRCDTDNRTFFLNRFDEPLGVSGVQKMLRRHLKNAGIGRVSVHTLRHTFGAQHVAKGTSLKTVQDVLGHKDPRSTEVYRFLAKEVVRKELLENSL